MASRMVSRFARPTRVSLRFALTPAAQVRNYSKFDERENAFENMDVQKHDQELLRKLAEKNRQAGTSGQTAAPQGGSQNAASRPAPQASAGSASAPSGYVSAAEFNEFRKDIVNRIRALEEKASKR